MVWQLRSIASQIGRRLGLPRQQIGLVQQFSIGERVGGLEPVTVRVAEPIGERERVPIVGGARIHADRCAIRDAGVEHETMPHAARLTAIEHGRPDLTRLRVARTTLRGERRPPVRAIVPGRALRGDERSSTEKPHGVVLRQRFRGGRGTDRVALPG